MQNLKRSRNQKWIFTCLSACLLFGAAALVTVESEAGGGTGPDVTVFELNGTRNYGETSGIRAYSVGTTSCNVGTEPLLWCDFDIPGSCDSNEHPVIGQNIYRLYDGRFEQLGASWLKHGFLSLNLSDAACGNGSCIDPPLGGQSLGVGCTDPYGSTLNGSRPLGPRSEVNAATGDYPFPFTETGASTIIDQRIQVLDDEINPDLNPGARFFIEGQYVAPDDASAGNGLNNASYQEVNVASGSHDLLFIPGSGTVREKAAIQAWQAIDPVVELAVVDIPSSSPVERFHVARRVTNIGGGFYRYEYAVHNLNSDRSAQSFRVDFPQETSILNAGFRDVDNHSGEPYDTTNWSNTIDSAFGTITWFTDTEASNPNANALRWGTMYNFWFEANDPGVGIEHTLGLFKAGSPMSVDIRLENTSFLFADAFESGDTSGWSVTVP